MERLRVEECEKGGRDSERRAKRVRADKRKSGRRGEVETE